MTFIEELIERARQETKVKAVLKRSLAFEPGVYPPAFPFIEYLQNTWRTSWDRKVYYLVAGLWASHWREEDIITGSFQSLAIVCKKLYLDKEQSPSIEQRFISLIDADIEQLPHRLRQMIALLKHYDVDFNILLSDLQKWKHPDRRIQIKWAREFYSSKTYIQKEKIMNNEEKI